MVPSHKSLSRGVALAWCSCFDVGGLGGCRLEVEGDSGFNVALSSRLPHSCVSQAAKGSTLHSLITL